MKKIKDDEWVYYDQHGRINDRIGRCVAYVDMWGFELNNGRFDFSLSEDSMGNLYLRAYPKDKAAEKKYLKSLKDKKKKDLK